MQGEHHDLLHEFPQHRERIHELKIHDELFRKLFDEYHDVDKEIHRIESGIEPTSDDVAEAFKKKRLALKDELLAMIQAS